jgi:hypothetical protein
VADLIQTNLQLSPAARADLEEVAKTYGWSLAETVERAVRVLGPLVEAALEEAQKVGGERGELLERIARDYPVARFFESYDAKNWVRSEVDGRLGLRVGDAVIFIGPDDELMVSEPRGNSLEICAVRRNGLTLIRSVPTGEPALN